MRQTLPILLVCFMTSVAVAATGQRTADVTLPRTVEHDDPQAANDGYTLSPAYPNPFNPRTSFTLRVEETQELIVEVFNLLGTRIETLYSGVLEGGKPRTFTFTAEDLPSGIYLYRVEGEHFTATRQMTLLK